MKKKDSLPAVKDLLIETFATWKATLVPLVILSVVGFLGYTVLFFLAVVFGIASFAPMLSMVMKHVQEPLYYLQALPHVNLWLLLFGMLVIGAGCIILSAVLQVAAVLLIDRVGKKVAYGALLRESLSSFWPLVWVGSIESLLLFGSFYFFVIPMIIMAIFFAFVAYEVIIQKSRGVTALKRSTFLVGHHFWAIVIRIFILIAMAIFVNILFSNIESGNTSGGGLSFIANTLLQWFATVYMIVLYKQVKSGHDSEKGSSILWMVVISVVGWIIAVMLLISAYQFIVGGGLQTIFDGMQKQQQQKIYYPARTQLLYPLKGSNVQEL